MCSPRTTPVGRTRLFQSYTSPSYSYVLRTKLQSRFSALPVLLCFVFYIDDSRSNQWYRLRAAAGIPTYRYLYAGNFSNISPRPWMGAYHQAELPLLFGTHGNHRGPSTKYENLVSEAMQDAWQAFADNPQHGLMGQHWEQFTPRRNVVRSFGDNGTVARNGIGELKIYEDQC
jgi:hypothetical protein